MIVCVGEGEGLCFCQFMQQYQHYLSLKELLIDSPAQDLTHLSEIVMFIGQVCNPNTTVNSEIVTKGKWPSN